MDFLKSFVRSFIPNSENEYKPHFFRAQAMLTLALTIVVLGAGAFTLEKIIVKNQDYLAAVISSVLVDLTNTDRQNNGLGGLKVNPILQRAAQMKADDMAAKGYFAHTSPDNITPWHWFKEAGYDFTYAGENLAVRFSDSVDVENAWMNSPGHRANILNSKFSEIGIATAQGLYEGQSVVFVVQEFGNPAVPQKKVATVAPKVVVTTTPVPKVQPPEVAGTSIEQVTPQPKVILEDKNFIAVKSEPATSSPLAASASTDASISLVQKLITSPRTLVNTIYLILAAVIAVALALMIGIELKHQHPLNVLYGVLLIVLMGFILYFWQVLPPGSLLVI